MFRRVAGLLLAEPFAEMPEPRGESSFVAGPVVRSAVFSCVIHENAREISEKRPPASKPRGPY